MINEFKSSFTDELARPSRFKVTITLPPVIAGKGITDSKHLSLRCENAQLPGRTIATGDLRIYGPTEKFPYQSSYDDIPLTFIVGNSMLEKTLFNQWMDFINPTQSWNFEYKKNYATTIKITQYDLLNNEVHIVKLIDAFPVSISQMDLDWSNDNTYHKVNVTFAYTYWEIEATAQPSYVLSSGARNSPFNLAAAIQIGALAASAGKALSNGNPYALLGLAGAATSVIPSLGGTKTLSSVLNTQGRGALDTQLDRDASRVNQNNFSIPGSSISTNNFKP